MAPRRRLTLTSLLHAAVSPAAAWPNQTDQRRTLMLAWHGGIALQTLHGCDTGLSPSAPLDHALEHLQRVNPVGLDVTWVGYLIGDSLRQ